MKIWKNLSVIVVIFYIKVPKNTGFRNTLTILLVYQCFHIAASAQNNEITDRSKTGCTNLKTYNSGGKTCRRTTATEMRANEPRNSPLLVSLFPPYNHCFRVDMWRHCPLFSTCSEKSSAIQNLSRCAT